MSRLKKTSEESFRIIPTKKKRKRASLLKKMNGLKGLLLGKIILGKPKYLDL